MCIVVNLLIKFPLLDVEFDTPPMLIIVREQVKFTIILKINKNMKSTKTMLPQVVEVMGQVMADLKTTSEGNELLILSDGVKATDIWIKSKVLDAFEVNGKPYREWITNGAYIILKYEVCVPNKTHYINQDGDTVVHSGSREFHRPIGIIPLDNGKAIEARRAASMFNLTGEDLTRFAIAYINH